MKFCFVIGFYPEIVGGAEYQARMIANELSKNHEIVYISFDHQTSTCESIDGFKVYKISNKNLIFHKFTFYYFLMRRVTNIIDNEKPDIIYQRILNSFSSYLGRKSNKMSIPFVLHIADDKCLKFEKFSLSTLVRRFLFRSLLRNDPHFICQTTSQRNLLNKFGCDVDLLIPNFSPILDFQEKNIGKKKKIVWIANVRPFKQLEVFLALVDTLSFRSELEFCIIGNIPKDAYGRKLIDDINSNKRIVYYGKRSNDFINMFLKDAFVLVNTSAVSSEGFSNTFIQAWMTGTPVLTLNCDPNDYISTFGLGYNSLGDVGFLKEKILTMLELREENYQILSNRCREFAINNFSIDKTFSSFLKVIETVVR